MYGQVVVQVSCGSRDAQTLCLTKEGLVYSWGDGDFGKLGRGGSDGCSVPKVVDKLTGQNVVRVGKLYHASQTFFFVAGFSSCSFFERRSATA